MHRNIVVSIFGMFQVQMSQSGTDGVEGHIKVKAIAATVKGNSTPASNNNHAFHLSNTLTLCVAFKVIIAGKVKLTAD